MQENGREKKNGGLYYKDHQDMQDNDHYTVLIKVHYSNKM